MIYFDKVAKHYRDGTPALEEVTLSIAPKEFISIVGHSGAGKTTLLKMLLAEERPSTGTVFFESVDVHTLPKNSLHHYRRKIGTVFQDFRLVPNKTAYENIAFAMEAAGRPDDEIASDVPYILELVDLASKANHFPHQLSGGEQQRVAVARALMNAPAVILADEPSGNLDTETSQELHELFFHLRDKIQQTFVIVTHNTELAKMSDRTLVMKDGLIIDNQINQ